MQVVSKPERLLVIDSHLSFRHNELASFLIFSQVRTARLELAGG
jgi:hypothetical protein